MRPLQSWLVASVAAACIALPALADDGEKKKVEPPAAVKASTEKAYPGARIESCEEEKEDGKTEYECKVETKEKKKLELVFNAEGRLIEIEEKVALDAVPPAVTKALGAKHPGAKVLKAEKQTKIDEKDDKVRKVFYELKFEAGGKKMEALFGEDGTLVEEEEDD